MEDHTKKCGKCQVEKAFSEFNKCRGKPFDLHSHCRACQKICKDSWYAKNKDWVKEYGQLPEVKAKVREIAKKRYHSNEEYRKKHLESNRIRRRKEPAKIMARKYEKMRLKTDINYKLGKILRGRVRGAITKIKLQLNIDIHKCASTLELLGCSLTDLKIHLEKHFQPGMTWENHGLGDNKWHVDHILPCDSFDLTQESEQRKCFHYTNLQPLWQFDNLSKNNKII
jgi:Prasinovirus endonuclease VII